MYVSLSPLWRPLRVGVSRRHLPSLTRLPWSAVYPHYPVRTERTMGKPWIILMKSSNVGFQNRFISIEFIHYAKEFKLSCFVGRKKSSILRTPCFSSRSCEVQAVFANNSVNTFQSSASIKLKAFFDAILSIELATTFGSYDHENQCGRYTFHRNLR